MSNDGFTPLHMAVRNGDFDIYRLITENMENKNPACHLGFTHLHTAALKGHFDICELIIKNVENRNPVSYNWYTPLLNAAWKGHFEICKLIIENVGHKNPDDTFGYAPSYDAARKGHFKICRFIINSVVEKNLATSNSKAQILMENLKFYLNISYIFIIIFRRFGSRRFGSRRFGSRRFGSRRFLMYFIFFFLLWRFGILTTCLEMLYYIMQFWMAIVKSTCWFFLLFRCEIIYTFHYLIHLEVHLLIFWKFSSHYAHIPYLMFINFVQNFHAIK